MFRKRDVSTYDGMLSTGDTVSLALVPHKQLQQTLCCSLAYIQRGEAMATSFLSVVGAFRSEGAFGKKYRAPKFTADAKIRDRYDPGCFNADVDDGTLVFVSDMSTEQLLGCTMRAFIVCEHVIEQNDGFKWWGHRPAVTVGPRLKAFMAHSESLPALSTIECNRVYSRVRSLDPSIKARLVEEMGVYEDVPEYASSASALMNIPLQVDDVSLKPAIAEFLGRLAL